jgi:hypothetical protein
MLLVFALLKRLFKITNFYLKIGLYPAYLLPKQLLKI